MEKVKMLQNLHTHTKFCDGDNTCEEMVEQAIKLGFNSLGFSAHGYVGDFSFYSLTKEATESYINEVNRLKAKYKGIIDIFLGLEFDYYTLDNANRYDYTIGSVHYYKASEDQAFSLDFSTPEELLFTIDTVFEGDPLKLAKKYYELVSDLPNKFGKIDIVGHLDLILKSNDKFKTIDTENNTYRGYVRECLRSLMGKVKVFEVNTGAIARGMKTIPYPQDWALKEIRELGGKIILSSDCHKMEKMNYWFDDGIEFVKSCGFDEIQYFNGKEFEPIKI